MPSPELSAVAARQAADAVSGIDAVCDQVVGAAARGSERQLRKDKVGGWKTGFTCKPVGNKGVDERSGSGGEKQGRTWKKCGTFKNGLFFKS